jgi:predicted amidophosphoribosyltransferase
LDRKQRRINIKNAFSVSRPGQSAGKRVLLVDDVLTTGATVDACSDALIRDGAKRVDVLTLARAL